MIAPHRLSLFIYKLISILSYYFAIEKQILHCTGSYTRNKFIFINIVYLKQSFVPDLVCKSILMGFNGNQFIIVSCLGGVSWFLAGLSVVLTVLLIRQ